MKQPAALLFGAIGSLVESSALQYRSFLRAFEEAGLDWSWSLDEYQEMLRTPGGLQRIREYAESRGDLVDANTLYQRKNELFHEGLRENRPPLRAGVESTIEQCKREGIPLGFVTTTTRDTIDTILEIVPGISAEDFAFIGDETMVEKGKPNPDIYELAIAEMGLDEQKEEVLAIEDSPSSRRAAVDAGLPCVFFPGNYILDRLYGVEALDDLTPLLA